MYYVYMITSLQMPIVKLKEKNISLKTFRNFYKHGKKHEVNILSLLITNI